MRGRKTAGSLIFQVLQSYKWDISTYVSRIDLQKVFDGQLIRDALEIKVVGLAAIKMSSTFERRLDFNMYQQKRLAAELDHDESTSSMKPFTV